MLIIKRLVAYISGILILVSFELFLLFPNIWYLWLVFVLALVITTIFILNNYKLDFNLIGFSTSPFFFILGCFCFLFFMENIYLLQLVALGGPLLYFLMIDNLYYFLFSNAKYRPNSLENISNYLNLLAIFFLYTSAFSFHILAVGRLRYTVILVFIATLFLAWQTLWINKHVDSRNRYFILLLCVCLTEMYWALHYWPTGFLVNGLLLTTLFYLSLNLIRYYLTQALSKRLAYRYLIIGSIIIVTTLMTAQWT